MQQPTIGILAGMGPRSTAPFIDLVITECQEQYGAKDDIDFPKMMICSLPAPFYPDRATDHAAMEATLRAGIEGLARTGVDFIAIPCNTAHIYYPKLSACIDVPLLNMVELALDAVPEPARSIALIAARPTVESGIYQDGVRRRGGQPIDVDWQREVDALIGATRTSRDPALFRARWDSLLRRAKSAGADAVLLACMDLSAIKAHIETDLLLIDAGQCLARGIVAQWLSRRRAAALEAEGSEHRHGRYRVSSNPQELDVAAIHAYLTRSYWAAGITRELVAQSLQGSMCFGLFDEDRQVGFARVVTDGSTFAYLCDVYVLEEHRGQGLGKWLVGIVAEHPTLKKVRRFVLATKDAHGLYARFGFTPLPAPERYMEIFRPEVYQPAR
ncbi:GNAT family N-acetyltransferase [Sorangium sp. So ce1078]|uniref:GNAT family N-acetyltransferase n=1 Tax=Sorangium sp. So ce1078 TaxID=3133329 RepID=UPI003F613274